MISGTSRIQIYYREILKKGQNYQICAVYEKGSTGIYSFSYNDAFIVNEYWHERNFSDREEKDLPDIVQKEPASSEVVQEEKKENLYPEKMSQRFPVSQTLHFHSVGS